MSSSETVILPTAVVKIVCGDFVGAARILIDPCSQPSALISEEFVNKYKLTRSPSHSSTTVHGVGGLVNATHECRFEIYSRFGGFSLDVKADIVPESCFGYSINSLRIGADVTHANTILFLLKIHVRPTSQGNNTKWVTELEDY